MAKKYKVTFNEDKCKGCELCCSVCPRNLISIGHYPNIRGYHSAEITDRQDECIGCQNCAIICPDGVIEIYQED